MSKILFELLFKNKKKKRGLVIKMKKDRKEKFSIRKFSRLLTKRPKYQ